MASARSAQARGRIALPGLMVRIADSGETAKTVSSEAAQLEAEARVEAARRSAAARLHEADAYELAAQWPQLEGDGDATQLDLLWLDFGIGVAGRLDEFLSAWWPRLLGLS